MGDRFTIYRSSAGSGKTHTLVKEYLRLALSDPGNPARFAKILAITFTNKAAGEMKERVMENLFTLQVPPNHRAYKQHYLDEMSDFCRLPAREIQLRAARVFKTMLHNYHLLKITTIDKFTVSLVYSFARDLNIDADHEIVTDTNEVIDAGVQALIEQSGKDEELTSIFLNFLGRGIEEGDRFNIRKELRNFCSKVLDEKGYKALEVAAGYSEKDFLDAHFIASEKIKALEQQVRQHTQAMLDLLEQNGIGPTDFFNKGSGNYTWIKKIHKEGFEEIEEAAMVAKFIEGKRWQKDASPEKKAAFARAEDALVYHMQALLQLRKKERNHFLVHATVRNHTFSMALFKRLQEAIERYKTSNSIILLSEFTKLVSDIVSDEPAPFIYERLGERVKNIFVDEFQDTSSLQFGNLIPLMENSLATGDFVMLVGDAKQSIYRWRNGNVEQFIDLPRLPSTSTAHHPYRQKVFEGQSSEKTLPRNYRSLQHIIRFNNTFFEQLLKAEIFSVPTIQTAYRDVQQENQEKKKGGYVEFVVNYEKKNKQQEEDHETAGAEKEIAHTVSWIGQAVENGYAYGDIAVLVRQHKDGEKIFNGLRQHGIPVVSNQAMSLAGSDELKTINALFACLHEPGSLTRIRKFAFLLAKTRNTLAQHESFIARLYGKPGVALLTDIFRQMDVRFNPDFFYSLNLYEQVYYIIHCLGFKKENAFVSTYIELVFEFFRKHGSHAVRFVRWWETNADRFKLQTGSGADSVQIVTIHQSKGLQYPVVILPFVNWTIRQSDKYFWLYEVPGYNISPLPVPLSKRLNDSDWKTEHELENMRSAFDVLNIRYLAFTRAEEQLLCYVDATGQGLGKQIACVLDTLSGTQHTEKYTLGEPVCREKRTKETVAGPVHTAIPEQEKFLPWHNKLMVTAHFYQQYTDEHPAQRRGLLVHEIFAGLQEAGEVDRGLARYRQLGVLSDTELEEVKTDLEHLLGSETFRRLSLGACQLPEVEIFDGEKNIYRPDRLFIYPGNTAALGLLDLKTGDEEDQHLLQVRNYSHIMHKAGYTQVEAWIYYVKTRKWIKVD